jgi:Secretion system C-terminal sorting domain
MFIFSIAVVQNTIVIAQTYYPLAANRTVHNSPLEIKETDSGIVALIFEGTIQPNSRIVVSSKLVRKDINAITKSGRETEILWDSSAGAVYSPYVCQLDNGTFIVAAAVPLPGQNIDLASAGSQLVVPWLLHFDSSLHLINAKQLIELGNIFFDYVCFGSLSKNKLLMSVTAKNAITKTNHYLLDVPSFSVIDSLYLNINYMLPEQWVQLDQNKFVTSNNAAQHFIMDSMLNHTMPFFAQVLNGYNTLHNTIGAAKFENKPIYNADLDSANKTKQYICLYSFDTNKASKTSIIYLEQSLTAIYTNQTRFNVSVHDSDIYFGTNFYPCSIWSYGSNCTNEQVIRKVRNGSLVWMKTLGGDAGYFLNQVIATKTGIWVISLRNKTGENIDQFDTYYALLDSNGNDIGPVIPFLTNTTKQATKEEIILTPNPATTSVTISTTFSGNYKLTITNQLGQMMYESKNASNKIDISKYAPGLYRFAVEHQNKKYVQMVVKQ